MKKIALLALMAMMLGGCGTNVVVEEVVTDEVVVVDEVAEEISVYCTQEPTMNEMGATIYPIDEKYVDHLPYLGQLFTAYECEGRIAEVWGDTYDLGSTLWLYAAPSPEFLEALIAVGYECSENTDSEETCSVWKLEDEVSVGSLSDLERFYGEINMDDCVHCG